MQIAKLMKLLEFNVQQVGYYKFQKIIFLSEDSSDAQRNILLKTPTRGLQY